jgi:hypothetical protein
VGRLLEFNRASDNCLAELDVFERVIDLDRLFRICNNETSGIDGRNFITWLRTTESPIANFIKSNGNFSRYFQVDEEDGSVSLVDEIITDQSVVFNCTEEENFCWNQVLEFVSNSNQQYFGELICQDIYSKQAIALAVEQSLVRTALCLVENATSVPSQCGDLKAQIDAYKAENQDMDCTDIGTRAALSQLPPLDTCNAEVRAADDTSGSAVAATSWIGGLLWASTLLLGMGRQ